MDPTVSSLSNFGPPTPEEDEPQARLYTKIASLREVTLTQKAAAAGVAPPVLDVRPDGDKPRFLLTTKVLGPTLFGLFLPPFRGSTPESRVDEYCAYAKGIYDAYDRLHAIGILHNDPSEENVVIEVNTPFTLLSGEVIAYRVWIIDYGMSTDVASLSPEGWKDEPMAEEVMDRFGAEYAPKSLEDLFLMEKSAMCFIRAPSYPDMVGVKGH